MSCEAMRMSCHISSCRVGIRISLCARTGSQGASCAALSGPPCGARQTSEGGMIRLETLIELKLFNSSVVYLIELRQITFYQAIRANSISINSILPSS